MFVTIDGNYFFKRIKTADQFIGSARQYSFDGSRGMELNEDAYAILELLDRGLPLRECVAELALQYDIEASELEPIVQTVIQQAVKSGVATISRTKPRAGRTVIPPCLELPYRNLLEKVTVELTSRCNLTCKHCYGSFRPNRGDHLELKTIFGIFDQLQNLHCGNVNFTGGEPFLHPHFWDILDGAINRRHFHVTITSNGTMINSAAVRRLKDTGRVDMNISIDGHNAAINDEFRGMAGGFDRAVAAIEQLKGEGFEVKIIHTVHRSSLGHVDKMWDLADRLGVGILLAQVYRMGRCNESGDDIRIEPQEFFQAIHSTRRRMKTTIQTESESPTTGSSIKRCDGGNDKIAIRCNGNVTPCIAYPHERRFVMGNIQKSPIRDIFYGFDRDRILGSNNALEIEECAHCPAISTCKSGCLAIAFAETGRMDRKDPFSCARYRALID